MSGHLYLKVLYRGTNLCRFPWMQCWFSFTVYSERGGFKDFYNTYYWLKKKKTDMRILPVAKYSISNCTFKN